MPQGSGPSRAKARHLYHSGCVASSFQPLLQPLPAFACRSHRCGGECGGCRPACGFDAYNSGSTAVVSYLDVSVTGCCYAHVAILFVHLVSVRVQAVCCGCASGSCNHQGLCLGALC